MIPEETSAKPITIEIRNKINYNKKGEVAKHGSFPIKSLTIMRREKDALKTKRPGSGFYVIRPG
jgi:hypothetical protein